MGQGVVGARIYAQTSTGRYDRGGQRAVGERQTFGLAFLPDQE